jgi:hypothetical protein
MAFPSSPLNGQQYTIGNSTWEWISAQGCWNLLDVTNVYSTTTQVFTSSGTWNIPSNASMAHITLIGGGSGGRPATTVNSTSGSGGDGGGGGALTSALMDVANLLVYISPATSVTVTIGVGGVSATAGGATIVDILKAGGGIAPTGFGNYTGGLGLFRGGGGGSGSSVTASGSTAGSAGVTSYGGPGGGNGGSASNASFSVSGGAGGGSPVYTMATGDTYASNIQNMPVPGIVDNTGTPKFGAGGNGGNYSSGTSTSGQTGADGVAVIKVWYNS